MFRNYFAAALHNLMRNRLYAAINIVGLAVGFAAALLIALFVRDEFSYDRFIPGHDNIYRVSRKVSEAGFAPKQVEQIPPTIPNLLKLDFPQIQAIARLVVPVPGRNGTPTTGLSLRHGDVEAIEQNFYWADPNIFDVLPLPSIAGDLKTALEGSDGIVLTRRMARKYFGRDDPIGETIEINRQNSMTVRAVLEDLPSNTHLNTEIFASGRASFSDIAKADAGTPGVFIGPYVYLRLASGSSIDELAQALPGFLDRHFPPVSPNIKHSEFERLEVVPIAGVHLFPAGQGAMKPGGNVQAIYSASAVGLLIVLVASINFVNLMTARAARRAVEVGIRKVSGADRLDLISQFIGESLIYAALAVVLAIALVELLLPTLNTFLNRRIIFDYWRDSGLMGGIVGLVLIVGILAGSYPAFVLSAFRPASVLKGGVIQVAGSGMVRQALVVIQFAILIGLILVTAIIYRQTVYAMNEGLRFDKDQVLAINTPAGSCQNAAFKDEIQKLPGVRAVACSDDFMGSRPHDIHALGVFLNSVDAGFLDLLGLKPLAGRFFSSDHVGDNRPPGSPNWRFVINESAVRQLGFVSAENAIGKTLQLVPNIQVEIIGVVSDLPNDSIHQPNQPTVYVEDPSVFVRLNAKLNGLEIPETLKAIDRLWDAQPDRVGQITRAFFDQYVEDRYRDTTSQSAMFQAFAGVALFIACLGLFGLSVFTTERRTKEIGIRKAMGASRLDIVKLLVWQFTKPVLWANLIAWPVGWYFMNRWLHGFAYHVDLEPWIFLAAAALALAIALATVSAHAFLVARAKPVAALRYE